MQIVQNLSTLLRPCPYKHSYLHLVHVVFVVDVNSNELLSMPGLVINTNNPVLKM